MIEHITTSFAKMVQLLKDLVLEHGAEVAMKVVAAVAILVIGFFCIKFFTKLLKNFFEKKMADSELLQHFFISVFRKVMWVVLLVIVLDLFGISVLPFVTGLGVTGVVLGFAFQETLGSLASGIMLAFNKPFKLGDYVSVGGYEGIIKQLDIMAVVLATADNRKITIPNKQVWGSPIVNYSALELRRVEISVGIAYGSDIAKAKEVAINTLCQIPNVLVEHTPEAEVKSLSDSAVLFTCRVWVKNADYWAVFFAANERIHDSFTQNGIQIPFPQLDVHIVQK